MNNFRLQTNKFNLNLDNNLLQEKVSNLFAKPAPYEIKNGVRLLAGSNILVSEKVKIGVVDSKGKNLIFSSITDCSEQLKIGRKTIKECILSNKIYKGYTFYYNS